MSSDTVLKLNDSDAELVVVPANGNLATALDLCDEIRRNSALYHMPILAICGADPDHAIQAYCHGATAACALPFDGDEIRARVTISVKLHRLRGFMLNAYSVGGHRAVSDSATGLYSAEFFRQHLQTLTDDAFRRDKNLSLNGITVREIDHIRNEYGNTAANHMTHQLSGMISRLVRGEDLCARLNNTTFCIALPENPLEATSPTMQRLARVLLITEFSLLEVAKPLVVHPKINSTEFKPGDTADDLIARATSAAAARHAA